MNQKLTQLLKDAKEQEQQKRNAHLVSIGLVDETKTIKEECSSTQPDAEYDFETGKYYIVKYDAIDVTDEEYAEICKYYPDEESSSKLEQNVATIKSILVFFTWLWGIGVAIWIIILLTNL